MFNFLKKKPKATKPKTKKAMVPIKKIRKIDKKRRQQLVLHETEPKKNAKVIVKGQETWYYNALSTYAVNYTFGLSNPNSAREVAPDMFVTPAPTAGSEYAQLAAAEIREAILEDTDIDLHKLYLTKYKAH